METQVLTLQPFLEELSEAIQGRSTLPLDAHCTGGDREVAPDEKLLGEVPPGPLRIAWLLARYYERRVAELAIAMKFSADQNNPTLHSLLHQCSGREKAYRGVFWTGLLDNQTFDSCKGVGLRKGWGVVDDDDSETTGKKKAVVALLKRLSGLGVIDVREVLKNDDDDDDDGE